jgi:hypothetical protein
MNDLLEIIEDLEMLEVLNDGGGKDAHIEFLLSKYRTRFEDMEQDLERQGEFAFYGS